MFYKPHEPHGLPRNPFKSLVVPRPIGWISSQDRDGRVNLAPYSFFNAMSSDPPVVIFGSNGSHVDSGLKDSAANARETGAFVCNIVTYELREAMNKTSASLARDIDEFEVARLTKAPSTLVAPPRVAECPAHFECEYLQTVELPADNPAQPNLVVFGRVLGIHIDERILKEGLVDMSAFKPLARLGYMDYTFVDNAFTMLRP